MKIKKKATPKIERKKRMSRKEERRLLNEKTKGSNKESKL